MTLKEMAAELGVSTSTISRVLNGCNKNFSVKPEVREKIIDFAHAVGYQANPVFKAIRTLESRQIAVLFRKRSVIKAGYVMEQALDAVEEVLEEQNYELNYILSAGTFDTPYRLPHWKVAGVIVPDVLAYERLSEIEASGLPYVSLNGLCGSSGSSVISDETANMRIVFEHLLSLGHQRIGFANSHVIKHQHYSIYDRENAYIQLCKEFKLPEIAGYKVSSSPLEDTFDHFIQQKVTAVIAYDEYIAQRLLYLAWQRGIRIPAELSIVGFNDTEINKFLTPPLTSLSIPAGDMGRSAAQLLINKIRKPDSTNNDIIKISGDLIVRESTGVKP
jgi:DNA-binding LacI/PurR family transcriptional regulator